MRTAGRYIVAYVAAAGLGVAAALAVPLELRREVGYGVLIALVLQGPLGWWVVSALGTERFTLVWGIGVLIRFAVLALVALVAVPALGWAPLPVLLALVLMLGALLAAEAIAAIGHSSQG
jgi:hypothetical protein